MPIDATAAIDPVALANMRNSLQGDVLVPDAPHYDVARRLVNHRFDNQPAVIVRCRSAQDVIQAVRFARECNLEIAVRSGGHSVVGHSTCNHGMMIDLTQMNAIAVDPAQRTARVQPGATNGAFVLAAQAHGLATTTGTCATVGMGGSTLGGGIGWLIGRFGTTIDNVLAFEIITAEGECLQASANEHADLFWALRGGGGNFGVVTAITYQLHPLSTVLGGMMIFRLDDAAQALRAYRQITSNAPDELIIHAVLATVPDFGPALLVQACYAGADLAEGARLLEPLRHTGLFAIDLIAPRSYGDMYMMLTPPLPPGGSFYDTSYALRQPSEAAFDEIVALAGARPTPLGIIGIHQVHGAATRVPANATAFALREPHYVVANIGMWIAGDGAAESAWSQQARDRMEPFASAGLYVNFLGDAGDAAVREAYRANYDRLATIKRCYDPENIFHRNQNIRPA